MGKRLSKIYTRTGDKGDTGLGDGSRLPKDHARVHAMGSIDETNSQLGLLIEEIRVNDDVAPLNIAKLKKLAPRRFCDGNSLEKVEACPGFV